eukprot:5286658-Pyramimonas_sp.AAC.1
MGMGMQQELDHKKPSTRTPNPETPGRPLTCGVGASRSTWQNHRYFLPEKSRAPWRQAGCSLAWASTAGIGPTRPRGAQERGGVGTSGRLALLEPCQTS